LTLCITASSFVLVFFHSWSVTRIRLKSLELDNSVSHYYVLTSFVVSSSFHRDQNYTSWFLGFYKAFRWSRLTTFRNFWSLRSSEGKWVIMSYYDSLDLWRWTRPGDPKRRQPTSSIRRVKTAISRNVTCLLLPFLCWTYNQKTRLLVQHDCKYVIIINISVIIYNSIGVNSVSIGNIVILMVALLVVTIVSALTEINVIVCL
jgi:hypothetical protein